MPYLSLIIPVYNEADNIIRVFDELRMKVSVPMEVLIVYDREEDNTLPVVRAVVARYPFTLRLTRNPSFREWAPDAQPAGYPDAISWSWPIKAPAISSGRGLAFPPRSFANLRMPASVSTTCWAPIRFIFFPTVIGARRATRP